MYVVFLNVFGNLRKKVIQVMFGIVRFGILSFITYQKFKKIHFDVNDLLAKNKPCYMRHAFFTLLRAFNTHTHTNDTYMEAVTILDIRLMKTH